MLNLMLRKNCQTFKVRALFCPVFYLCLCTILSIHSSARAYQAPVKSLAALADARKMIFHQGCLWAAGGGVTRYDIASGRAKQYVVEQGLAANAVFDAAVDGKNHVLWAATSCGLAKLDLETNQWKSFGRKEGLPDPFLLSLYIYEKQGKTRLFIGTRSDGLYFLPGDSDKIARAVNKKMLPDPWVSCIAADPGRNYLWVGTAAGVVRFQYIKGKRPLKIAPFPVHNDIAAKRLVVNERTGDVICLNYYNEIYFYRLSAKKWEAIPPPPGKAVKISDLLLDNAANILWTTTDRGIYQYRLKQKQWTRLPGFRGEGFCIALDPQSSILYFTSREGLHSFPGTMKLNKSFLPNSPPFNNTVNAIFIDEKSDIIWIGTDWGIAKFEKKNQQWKFFHLAAFPGEIVTALSAAGSTVWFGTMYHGPVKMDCKTGMMEEIKGTPDNSTVTCIIEDTALKKVWFGLLGTRGGVYEYNIEKKKLSVLSFLEGLSVTSMLEEGDWIWVGTGAGVAKFHKMKGPGPGLFNQRLAFGDVLTLALDTRRDRLWITTEHEVIVYDRAKKQHKIFKRPDGFPWSPITAILFAGERIWLGSEGYGLYMYNPFEKVKNPLTRVEGTADRYIISLAYDKSHGTVWTGTVSGGISIVNYRE
jgi:ligand-binding sensor domain-containing protein